MNGESSAGADSKTNGSSTQNAQFLNLDENASSLKRLTSLLRPYRWSLIIALAMLFTLAGVNMIIPALITKLLNEVLVDIQWGMLWWVLAGIFTANIARNMLYFGSKITAVNVGEEVCFNLRTRLFERLQSMNMRFYQKNNPGQISSRVMNDSFVVQTFIQDNLPTLLQALLLFIGLVAAIFAINWQLAIASTIVLPLHLITYHWFKRPIKNASRAAQEQLAVATGNLIEKFLGMEVVKSFTSEEREGQAFQEAIDKSRQSNLRSKTYHMFQKIVADVLSGVGTIFLLGYGAYQVMGPTQMRIGTLIGFYIYIKMLYPAVLELVSGFAKLTRATASIDRIFEMLGSDQTETSTHSTPLRKSIAGHVRFDRINFRYGDGPLVLRDVDMEIPAGNVCAIVGPSGAGKSTLIKLVSRFIDPSLGRMMIDDTNSRQMDTRELRKMISIAPQEPFLFDSTIIENIRYGKPDATLNQIVEVAKCTGAHEFITRLPRGYGTVLGPAGIALSRGEKQRITLTRALLKNPRILILDEATASIDKTMVSRIVPAILQKMRGKTVFIITHNAELLRYADMVVKIDDGQIIYQGDPAPMIEQLKKEQDAEQEAYAKQNASHSNYRISRSLIPLMLAGVLMLFTTSAFAQNKPAPKPPPAKPPVAKQPAAKPVPKPVAKPAPKPAPTPAKPVAKPAPKPQPKPAPKPQPKPASKPQPKPAPKPQPKPAPAAPAPGQLLAMTGLNSLETGELLDVVVMKIQTTMGYDKASPSLASSLPPLPKGMVNTITLAKSSEQGLKLLQLAYKTFKSQPPHIWVYGQTLTKEGVISNGDVPIISVMLSGGRKTLDQQYALMKVTDLATKKVKLSYTDPKRCLSILSSMGYMTIDVAGKPIDPKRLPAVMIMPSTVEHKLVGGLKASVQKNNDFPLTDADPISELLIFYHPAKTEQLSKLLDKINGTIDLPARQILIEAMVLEIAESGLEKLGVEWELEAPSGNLESLKLGLLPTFQTIDGEKPTADIVLKNVFGEFTAKIQALVKSGEAEVLSRPSVLTLDNRMANIAVEKRIPIVNSIAYPRNDVVTVSFKEVRAGITLNVRPRVNATGEEVSMQIVASVSARVPNEDVIVKNNNGDEVARSPTITSREVRTYTRIANNTPFIIGGLINKDYLKEVAKVPLLGDIPFVGEFLFSTTRTQTLRREVIIVITPYVLPENQFVSRNMPKDEDAFDSFGAALFRDAYRIRAEDVFDLGFLLTNKRLREMKRLANVAIRKNFKLADQYPFNRFVGKRVPGERILVYRQMYEVIKRLSIDQQVDPEKIIYFEPAPASPSGFKVNFLHRHLEKLLGIKLKKKFMSDQFEMNQLTEKLKGKALSFSYTMQVFGGSSDILKQPVPKVELLDCPDGEAYDRLLWQMNQPGKDGRQRWTILIRNAKDFDRLRRAMLVKRTARLNAIRQEMTLVNFSLGRLLLMPQVKEKKVYLIDEETAKFFYYTEQYYTAVEQELAQDLSALEAALRLPEINRLIDEPIPQSEPQIPVIDLKPIK